MAFTLNMTAVANVDDSIVKAYDQQFIISSAQQMVMDQMATYRASINAKSIEFPKYAKLALATTPLDEDDDVTSSALSDSQIILTPAEYGAVVTRTNLASLQTGGKVDLAAAKLVGINMGETLDKLALLALDASTNVATVTGGAESALVATDVMTVSFLNKMYNKLQRANVPKLSDGLYVAVLHPDVILDLINSASAGSWVDINKYSKPESVLMNEIGTLCGFKIVVDSHAFINPDGGNLLVDTYYSYFMGFNAFGKAVSQPEQMVISGPYDKLSRFLNLGFKACLQYKIIDQDALWVGISASSVGENV